MTLYLTLGGVTYHVYLRAGTIIRVKWNGHDVTKMLPEEEMKRIRAAVENNKGDDHV